MRFWSSHKSMAPRQALDSSPIFSLNLAVISRSYLSISIWVGLFRYHTRKIGNLKLADPNLCRTFHGYRATAKQCCQVLPKFPGQPSEKIWPITEKIWPATEMMEKAG